MFLKKAGEKPSAGEEAIWTREGDQKDVWRAAEVDIKPHTEQMQVRSGLNIKPHTEQMQVKS